MIIAGKDVVLRTASKADQAGIEALLTRLKLPTAGVSEWLDHFWVGERESEIVGVAGIELYGDGALLRSVAITPELQGGGLGRALVDRTLRSARDVGAREVYLLTTTAEGYFPRLGFEGTTRTEVPVAVQSSIEFREACPASAVVMRKVLG